MIEKNTILSLTINQGKKMAKKMFRVFRIWEMSGFDNIEAETQEEAEDIIDKDETPLPSNSEYLSGSCEVDRNFTMIYDKKKKEFVNCG